VQTPAAGFSQLGYAAFIQQVIRHGYRRQRPPALMLPGVVSYQAILNIRTEAELQQAMNNGLTETHGIDFKRVVGASEGARKDFAQDVAALAVDGGVFIVGVDEPQGGPIQLTPVDLTGEAERLIQIAGMRPEEGVPVRTWTVPSSSGNNLGYLFIHVPPSPRAPHQVDGNITAEPTRPTVLCRTRKSNDSWRSVSSSSRA
jgi:hypothetical protein